MNSMFYGASAFNQNISNWNLHTSVTFLSFSDASGLITDNKPPSFRSG
jgi:surface protein